MFRVVSSFDLQVAVPPVKASFQIVWRHNAGRVLGDWGSS